MISIITGFEIGGVKCFTEAIFYTHDQKNRRSELENCALIICF